MNVIDNCIVGEMDDGRASFRSDRAGVQLRRCAILPRRRYRKILAILRHVRDTDHTIAPLVSEALRSDEAFITEADRVD